MSARSQLSAREAVDVTNTRPAPRWVVAAGMTALVFVAGTAIWLSAHPPAVPNGVDFGEVSSPAPSESFEMWDGSTATLSDWRGRRLIVNFWASYCPPCIREMPLLEKAHRRLEGRVAFLGINTQDDREAAERLRLRTGVTYDLARDPKGRMYEAFRVFGKPSTFLVDRGGQIVARRTGPLELDELFELIESHAD